MKSSVIGAWAWRVRSIDFLRTRRSRLTRISFGFFCFGWTTKGEHQPMYSCCGTSSIMPSWTNWLIPCLSGSTFLPSRFTCLTPWNLHSYLWIILSKSVFLVVTLWTVYTSRFGFFSRPEASNMTMPKSSNVFRPNKGCESILPWIIAIVACVFLVSFSMVTRHSPITTGNSFVNVFNFIFVSFKFVPAVSFFNLLIDTHPWR